MSEGAVQPAACLRIGYIKVPNTKPPLRVHLGAGLVTGIRSALIMLPNPESQLGVGHLSPVLSFHIRA